MSSSKFAKLFEVDGKQVLVSKTKNYEGHYVNRFTTYMDSTEASIDLEYDKVEDRDKRFLSIGEAEAGSFLRMLK